MALYTISSKTGVGFEITRKGKTTGFFVPTMFRESAVERARQEWASGRPVTSAAIYEGGKIVRYLDSRDLAIQPDGSWKVTT
jgi:hypothetical protein